MEDLYAVLDLDSNASRQQIKDKYQKLILKHHPDKTQSSDTSMFVQLNHAYKILGDETLRKEYDDKWEARCHRQHLPIDQEVEFSDFGFDEEERLYFHQCRCGGDFILTEVDAKLLFDIVCCDLCSLTVKVVYAADTDGLVCSYQCGDDERTDRNEDVMKT
jgi:diphthamide biosynthesis protein 4